MSSNTFFFYEQAGKQDFFPPVVCWAKFSRVFSQYLLSRLENANVTFKIFLLHYLTWQISTKIFFFLFSKRAWITCFQERQTHDWKVSSLNPSRGSGRIFFSRVISVCWLLFSVHSTLLLPQWHIKRLRSFCQKCRLQVTHACIQVSDPLLLLSS